MKEGDIGKEGRERVNGETKLSPRCIINKEREGERERQRERERERQRERACD